MKKFSNSGVLFDSSVLVPVVYDQHNNHKKAVEFLTNYLKTDLRIVISTQNVLEISTVLSSIYKLSGNKIIELIKRFTSDPLVVVIFPNSDSIQKFYELIGKYPNSHFTDLFAINTLYYTIAVSTRR